MEQNKLYKFDFDCLFKSSHVKNGVLVCGKNICHRAKSITTKSDSLLIDQIKKATKSSKPLESLLVIMDFSSFVENKHNMKELSSFEEIQLTFDLIETNKEVTIRFKDFLKSNSMSKECQVYYFNCEGLNESSLFSQIRQRVTLGYSNILDNDMYLSKFYAYSGTLCSDCMLLKDIKFEEDEIIVVDDYEKTIYTDCFTMISIDYIYDILKDIASSARYCQSLDDLKQCDGFIRIDCIASSMKLEENSSSNYGDIIPLINDFFSITSLEYEEFKYKLNDIIGSRKYIKNADSEIKWEKIYVKNYPININMFDGEGIISMEFCKEITKALHTIHPDGKYDNSTSFQIRLPYVKGMVHACDFKEFFKEKGITSIKHIKYGDENKEYDISKIKMILTSSQFKLKSLLTKTSDSNLKINNYIKRINQYGYSFGIINANLPQKDNLCLLEYQFVSTLPLSINNIMSLLTKNNDVINDYCSKESITGSLVGNEKKIFEVNENFYLNTDRFSNQRKNKFNKLVNDAKFCKCSAQGTRKFLSGDLLQFLYYISFEKEEFVEKPELLKDSYYYMPNVGSPAVFLRSPHYSRNEIPLLNYDSSEQAERNKYFSHLNGTVMINPYGLGAERLGGADYDGDTVLVVDEPFILRAAKKLYKINGTKYLLAKIPSLGGDKKVYNNYNNRLECFQNTFSSRVGLLSNAAFYRAVEVYGEDFTTSNDHNEIAEYTILNGLEIDSAKNGKKPYMKDKTNTMTTDKAYKNFLKGKKEYEKNQSLKIYEEMLESIYDEFNLIPDGLIEDYSNNVLRTSFEMNRIKLKPLEDIEKVNKFKISKKEINIDEAYLKTLAICVSYKNMKSTFHRLLNHISIEKRKEILNNIYNEMNVVLNKKKSFNVDVNALLNEFRDIDNIEGNKLLNKYVQDNKFHFIKDKNERISYINDLFGDEMIDNNILDLLSSFDNDGFKLLYLLLQYKSKDLTNIEITDDSPKDMESKINSLNDKQKETYDYYLRKYNKQLKNIVKDYKEYKNEELKEQFIDYLKKQAWDLSFENVISVINIYKSDMVYDVFFDIVYNEFKKMEVFNYASAN